MLQMFLILLAAAVQAGGGPARDGTAVEPPMAQAAQVAEAQVPTGKFTTATEVRPILNATRATWVAVREWEGQDLIYVTHLWSWRCGLTGMSVSVNGAAPEPWPLPPCHDDLATPNAILESDGLPYRAFPLGSVAQIAVQITYDDLTTDSAVFDRSGVRIP